MSKPKTHPFPMRGTAKLIRMLPKQCQYLINIHKSKLVTPLQGLLPQYLGKNQSNCFNYSN